MKIEDISINLIDVTENVRLSKGDTEIKYLMESIKQHGLKEPIGVAKDGNKFVLLYGFRRLEAYQKLGYKTIPAVIGDPVKLDEQLVINTVENLQRRNVTPFELGRICLKLKKLKLSEGEIATRFSTTIGTISKAILVYNRIPAKMRDKVVFVGPGQQSKGGNIAAHTVYTVMRISKECGLTKKETEDLLEAVRTDKVSGFDLDNIARLVKSGLNAKDAIKKSADYRVMRIDISVKRNEFLALKKKYGMSNQDIMRCVCYGLIEHMKKPDFVKFTTIKTA